MKNSEKLFLTLVILCVSLISTNSFALQQYTDITPVIIGNTTIIPHFRNVDSNNDGKKDSMTFQFDVYTKNTNAKLYSTPIKRALYVDPLTICTKPDWTNMNIDSPKILRSGFRMIAGVGMITECGWSINSGNNKSAIKSFIYIADNSHPLGLAKSFVFDNPLVGLDLVDFNGDGVEHLMVTTLVGPHGSPQSLRIYVLNLANMTVVSDKTYTVYNP